MLENLRCVLLIGLGAKIREVLVGVCSLGRSIKVLLLSDLDWPVVIALHFQVLTCDLELHRDLEVTKTFDLRGRWMKP